MSKLAVDETGVERAAYDDDGVSKLHRITVEAKAGQVSLEGTAAMEEALTVTRGVPGVRGVKAEQVDIPPIPPFVA